MNERAAQIGIGVDALTKSREKIEAGTIERQRKLIVELRAELAEQKNLNLQLAKMIQSLLGPFLHEVENQALAMRRHVGQIRKTLTVVNQAARKSSEGQNNE